MTANVKIPVASAENVTAVPLASVFTEKNEDSAQMERFVYIQQGESFEKRNVKVGVSDYFYAEIQEGLAEGDVVAMELPKEEREKKVQQAANHKSGKGRKSAGTNAIPKAVAAMNSTGGGTSASPPETPVKSVSAAGPAATRSENSATR